MNDTLEQLLAEIQRQDEALAGIQASLRELGDVELIVPHAFLDELDELARPRNTPPAPVTGIRG